MISRYSVHTDHTSRGYEEDDWIEVDTQYGEIWEIKHKRYRYDDAVSKSNYEEETLFSIHKWHKVHNMVPPYLRGSPVRSVSQTSPHTPVVIVVDGEAITKLCELLREARRGQEYVVVQAVSR